MMHWTLFLVAQTVRLPTKIHSLCHSRPYKCIRALAIILVVRQNGLKEECLYGNSMPNIFLKSHSSFKKIINKLKTLMLKERKCLITT